MAALEEFKAICDQFIANAQAGNIAANQAFNIGAEFVGFNPVSPFIQEGPPPPPPTAPARPQVPQELPRVYNDDLGVYVGLWSLTPAPGAVPPPVPYLRVTGVWAKVAGQWKLVSAHTSRLPTG